MSKHNIKTPHAAVIVWNYDDRVSQPDKHAPFASGTTKSKVNDVQATIISTLSCVSIQTSKSKGQPEGTFNLVLAPYKNWVSTLTAGSWCAILMSNEPITKEDLRKAHKHKVKMIGKIETVRAQTQMREDGSRQTLYYVSGVDWGHVFNSVIYVDNLIASPNDPQSQGNSAAVAIRKMLFAKDGTPMSFYVKDNMKSLIDIFGKTVEGFGEAAKAINRLGGVKIYTLNMPKPMVDYFNFQKLTQQKDKKTKKYKTQSTKLKDQQHLNKVLSLITGSLREKDEPGKDSYVPSNEAKGFIDPFSLQGTNTFWQILLENSNPALNEMFSELRWLDDDDNGLALVLYNRIKPFSYKGYKATSSQKSNIKSYFQNIRTHRLEDDTIISVNFGTNWRDKYNFIEIF